jgi:hypothetical protein
MRWTSIVALLGVFAAYSAEAQTAIPSGTLIPASLSGSLNLKKLRSGQQFHAEVMQDIPGTEIKRRSHIVRHVVSLTPVPAGHARLEIAFDAVQWHNQRIPIRADLRAMASFNEVEDAQVPEEGASRGITPEVATTTQIGGEQVYRGGGPVADGDTVVGRPTPWGVLGVPRTQPGTTCRGEADHNKSQQAFWLFSTNACGVYGYSGLQIEHSGRSQPIGTVVLVSDTGKLNLQSGTAFLLRVVAQK